MQMLVGIFVPALITGFLLVIGQYGDFIRGVRFFSLLLALPLGFICIFLLFIGFPLFQWPQTPTAWLLYLACLSIVPDAIAYNKAHAPSESFFAFLGLAAISISVVLYPYLQGGWHQEAVTIFAGVWLIYAAIWQWYKWLRNDLRPWMIVLSFTVIFLGLAVVFYLSNVTVLAGMCVTIVSSLVAALIWAESNPAIFRVHLASNFIILMMLSLMLTGAYSYKVSPISFVILFAPLAVLPFMRQFYSKNLKGKVILLLFYFVPVLLALGWTVYLAWSKIIEQSPLGIE